mgnify:CR=1 FL=1
MCVACGDKRMGLALRANKLAGEHAVRSDPRADRLEVRQMRVRIEASYREAAIAPKELLRIELLGHIKRRRLPIRAVSRPQTVDVHDGQVERG